MIPGQTVDKLESENGGVTGQVAEKTSSVKNTDDKVGQETVNQVDSSVDGSNQLPGVVNKSTGQVSEELTQTTEETLLQKGGLTELTEKPITDNIKSEKINLI